MDHINILKRSWEILWRYRALWIFGIILAITASGRVGSSGSGSGYRTDAPDFNGNGQNWDQFGRFMEDLISGSETTILTAVLGFVCLAVLLGLAFLVLRWVANTALIRMVDEYEETEQRRTVGQGFRLGWSRASWRIFLIELVVNIPFILAALLLLALILSPLLLWLTENQVAGILGTIATVGLFFLFILVMLVVTTLVGVLKRFFHRAAALENLGVFDSIRSGYALVRRHLKDTALMWLILLGIQIAYSIAALVLGFLLAVLALIVGGGVGLLFGGFGALIGGDALPWILGLVTGLPLFILIIAIPFLLIGGWKEVYLSTNWTLAYREMKALDGNGNPLHPSPAPVFDNEGIVDAAAENLPATREPSVDDL